MNNDDLPMNLTPENFHKILSEITGKFNTSVLVTVEQSEYRTVFRKEWLGLKTVYRWVGTFSWEYSGKKYTLEDRQSNTTPSYARELCILNGEGEVMFTSTMKEEGMSYGHIQRDFMFPMNDAKDAIYKKEQDALDDIELGNAIRAVQRQFT